MNSKDLFSLVESYLNGGLSEEERNIFEQTLATDSHLQQQVEVSRAAQLALRRHKLYEIKNLSASLYLEEKKALKTKRIAVGVAGLALLVAGVAYVLLSNKKEATQIRPTIVPLSPTEQAIVLPKENTIAKIEHKTVTENVAPVSKPTQTEKAASTLPPAERSTLPFSISESNEPSSQPITTTAPSSPNVEAEVKVAESKSLPHPCADVALEAFVMTEPACLSEQNGRITISGFKGGQAPYYSTIFDESAQEVSAVRLGQGIYTALITDKRSCSKKLAGIVVKEIECKKDLELHAGNGEVIEWETAPASGHLALYDKGGNLYFRKEFAQGEKVQWDGASSHGEHLTGYFLFQLNYSDGKMRRGSVTVTR